mmetsp:Transcript_30698/g.73647  ORF Transcript_30698/g.73647 Transcript_30698/m.73647 type:complete len:98 (+) Transcript_30698:1015-1308(+)
MGKAYWEDPLELIGLINRLYTSGTKITKNPRNSIFILQLTTQVRKRTLLMYRLFVESVGNNMAFLKREYGFKRTTGISNKDDTSLPALKKDACIICI